MIDLAAALAFFAFILGAPVVLFLLFWSAGTSPIVGVPDPLDYIGADEGGILR